MSFEIVNAAIGLIGAVIGGGITSFTTWIIARGERTKHKRERIWDLRRDAYTKIIGSMVQANRLIGHVNKRYQFDAHESDSNVNVKQALNEFIDNFKNARDIFTSNSILISNEFSEKFESIHSKFDEIARDQDTAELNKLHMARAVINGGCRELLSLAKAEILDR